MFPQSSHLDLSGLAALFDASLLTSEPLHVSGSFFSGFELA
jgi:hypothetical protein